MKQRKKIDDIYRETLRSVDTPPPADSWDYISARLPRKKEKTRVIPLWWKLAGAAAVLAILFSIFNYAPVDLLQNEQNSITDSPAETTPESGTSATAYEETDEESDSSSENDSEAGTDSSSDVIPNSAAQTSVASATSEIKRSTSTTSETEALAIQTPEQRPIHEEGSGTSSTIAEATGISLELPENKLPIQPTPLPEESAEADALIAANEDLQNLTNEPDTEEENEKTSFLKRFRISTTAAAVYFDHLGSGNTVDEQFAGNAASGDVSASYGINLAYELSEKVKIRSGVNKVNLNYTTQNVDYAAAMRSEAIDQDPAASGTLLSSVSGSLEQELGFIEVPMEVEYALINRKIGLNLIGGASTLFLQDNNIAHITTGYSSSLGEAQNLNDISFTANLGLGLNYNISRQFRLNLEPMFKYQINTFTNVSGLNSYYFGIYSGLSFRF